MCSRCAVFVYSCLFYGKLCREVDLVSRSTSAKYGIAVILCKYLYLAPVGYLLEVIDPECRDLGIVGERDGVEDEIRVFYVVDVIVGVNVSVSAFCDIGLAVGVEFGASRSNLPSRARSGRYSSSPSSKLRAITICGFSLSETSRIAH